MRWVIVNLGFDSSEPQPSGEYLHQLPAERQAPIWRAFTRFLGLTRLEQAAEADSGRQYIVLNAIHTVFEPVVTQLLAVAMTPHTMRLRAGPVRRAPGAALYDTLARAVRQAVGHRDEPAATEISRAFGEALAMSADRGTTFEGSVPTIALLKSATLQKIVGADAEALGKLAARLEETRPVTKLAARLTVPLSAAIEGDAPPALGKLAAAEDWEDRDWRRWAETVAHDSFDYYRRDRAIWLQAQLLFIADRLGLLDPAKSVAVVAADGDEFSPRFAALRSAAGGALTVLSANDGATANHAPKRPLAVPPLATPVQPLSAAAGTQFDGVIVLAGCLPRFRALTRAGDFAKLVAPGGHLALSVEVAIDRNASNAWVPARALGDGTLDTRTGLAAVAPFDGRLSALTLDRTQLADAKPHPHLVLDNGDLVTWASWVGRR
jgi:hypothetical protein